MDLTTLDTVNTFQQGLIARIVDPGTAALDGYEADVASTTGWALARYDNNVYTQLGATGSATWVNGDGLGFEIIGSTLAIYQRSAGVWSQLGTRTDSTYAGAGRIGCYVNRSTAISDDFGGGTVVLGASPQRTLLGVGI